MKSTHTLLIILLLVSAGSAMFGGGTLIVDPTGSKLLLQVQLLENSPFKDYFVPGLVLFVAIGILSLIAAILVIMRQALASKFTILLGTILCGWILVQVYLLRTIHPLHVILGGFGFTLYCLGLMEEDNAPVSHQNKYD